MRGPAESHGAAPAAPGAHRYRWTILAVGVAATAAMAGLRVGLPALGPALRDAYDLSLAAVGLALSSVSIGIVLTLLAWGWLTDRLGERPVLAVGLGGAALALAGAAYAPSFPALVVALALAGMLGASATGASGRAVMGWFARGERGMALGVRQMAIPAGGALAALALPALAAAGGTRAALLALAGGLLLGALVSARWMREPPPAPPGRPKVEAPPPLRDGRLWRLAAGSALLVSAQAALVGFVVLFLHDERGLAVGAAAAVLAAFQVLGAAARPLVGRWSDKAEVRMPALRRLGTAAAAALLLTTALAAAEAPLALLLPSLVAAGALAMSWNGLSFTAAAEMSGRERAGTAIGVQNTVLSAGGALVPTAFGALVAATSWPLAFGALAALQVAGLLVLGPLVAEEAGRAAARRRRLAAAREGRAPRGMCEGSRPSDREGAVTG